MASILILLDDIATILDDVAILAKVATKKAAGVIGDDLAVNADQVSGVQADRELPVVWEVCKGSLKNKLILVPGALLLSAFVPVMVKILLIIGGIYLCYEGAEKVLHWIFPSKHDEEDKAALHAALLKPEVDFREVEREKIKGAIRSDFVLSAELVVIALGAFAGASMVNQIVALSLVAFGMTFFVYGVVALIIRMDDVGLALNKKESSVLKFIGRAMLRGAPALMKTLTVVGTVAMFTVGGGIISHALPFVNEYVKDNFYLSVLMDFLIGLLTGSFAILLINFLSGFKSRFVSFLNKNGDFGGVDRCISLVANDGLKLKYIPVKFRTLEVCLAAINKNGFALAYVPKELMDLNLCKTAFNQLRYSSLFERLLISIPDSIKTHNFYLFAVKIDGEFLKHVPRDIISSEICLAAVRKSSDVFYLVPNDLKNKKIINASKNLLTSEKFLIG